MDKNASQSRTRGPNYVWNNQLVRLLVEILHAYQRKNGKQPYNWVIISEEFFKRSGTTGVKDVCRNKFEAMKKDYKAWNLLRNAETGLGWDESTRTITASQEWWDRKIMEDTNCKKFRTKGMDAAYEEILHSLFSGNVATGRLARSAAMDVELSPQPDEPEIEIETAAVELEGLGTERGFFRSFVDTIIDDRASNQSGVGADCNDDPVQSTQTPLTNPEARITIEKQAVKRKRRQSVGSSRFEEHLAHSRANSDRMVALFQEEVNSRYRANEDKVKTCADIIRRMTQQGLLVKGTPLWCFAISVTKSKTLMNVFLNCFDDDDERIKWLTWEFEKSEK